MTNPDPATPNFPVITNPTFKRVAKDVSLIGGILIAIFSMLANVPGGLPLHASGQVQGIVDALIAVGTAITSLRNQL